MSQQGTDNQVEPEVDRANRATCRSTPPTCAGCRRRCRAAMRRGRRRAVHAFSGATVTNQFSQAAARRVSPTTMAETPAGGPSSIPTPSPPSSTRSSTTRRRITCSATRHQSRARRTLPPHQGPPEASGSETRIPLRLLRAARRALDEGRSRAAAADQLLWFRHGLSACPDRLSSG